MTEEEKQLLLKDLCARLPYGVKISFLNGTTLWTLTGMFESEYNGTMLIMLPPNPPKHSSPKTTNLPMKDCKPYLRSMSSMTEEEHNIIHDLLDCFNPKNELWMLTDFLDKRMLDHRGLIEKGLALEVTKENNPYKD